MKMETLFPLETTVTTGKTYMWCALSRVWSVVGSSPTRGSSFFLGKVTALGVLCCFALFVCLTLLASFFLPSHLSFKNMYIAMGTYLS